MIGWLIRILMLCVVAVGLAAAVVSFWPSLYWSSPPVPAALAKGDARRGETLFHLGGCASCHTAPGKDAKLLAGGRALKTEFGTFYAPNITPDKETGIGGWSDADFVRAMTLGQAPDGRHYYPSFPYTSYTRMTLRDLLDLKAYLDSAPAVRQANKPHELSFPYSIRPGIGVWKALFFRPGRYRPDPSKSAAWNRGAYIAMGPGHCAECHTPRNFAGALIEDQLFAGTKKSPEGGAVPNITQHEKGLKSWKESDIVFALQSGMLPSGDVMGGTMGDVVKNMGKVPPDDLKALATFLKSLPARAE